MSNDIIKNILIIAYDWVPRNVVSTHRPYSFAKYWSKLGYNITVITSKKKNYDYPLSLKLPTLPNVKVLSIDYNENVKYLKFLFYFSKSLKKIKIILSKFFKININLRKNWFKAVIIYLEQNRKQFDLNQFDLMVSTYGPQETHLIACEIKKINKNIFWVADYRDLWSQLDSRKIVKQIEIQTVGKYANSAIAVSEYLKKKIQSLLKIKTKKIFNGHDYNETELKKIFNNKKNSKQIPLRIVHTGTLFERRNPEPLLKAIASLHDKGEINYGDLIVEFYGQNLFYLDKIIKKNLKYIHFVKKKSHVNFNKIIQIQRNAGLLLILDNSIGHNKGNITGKLFEYMSSGRPLMLLGCSNKSEIAKIIKETRVGVVFGNSEHSKIENLIKKIIKERDISSFYRPKIKKIMQYSRKFQSEKMLNYIKKNFSK